MRKFLVVVDETPECLNAIRFAARRSASTGGRVMMLSIIEPEEFQHWIGVAEVMREEARAAAEERLSALADELHSLTGQTPEITIREGKRVDEVLAQIEEDPEIGILVLGAGEGDGPGPLVSAMVSKMGAKMPVPITVVPGALSLEKIDMVC